MASDQRFQRTVQAVAEAVQTFAAGTFDFAESIKQIWGPQPEPDAVETSDPLPVEGMQGVQTIDQLRERTPVSQNGDQPAINSHSNPPSVSMHDGELEAHEEIAPPETADMQLSSEMDALAGSTQQFTGSCYECFARWREPTRFPPCRSIRGKEACAYCIHMQIPCLMNVYNAKKEQIPAGQIQKMMERKRRAVFFRIVQNNSARKERERFAGASCETSDLVEMPLSSPNADVPQQQVGSKRAYQDIDEQRPESKRQRTQELWEILIPKRDRWLKKAMQQEQDDHGAAEDRVSSSLSVSSSSSSEEEQEVAPIKVEQNSQESSPFKISDMPRVARDMINKDVIHSEEENHRSSSLTQEQSSAASSSSDDDDYSSSKEEEQTVQHPTEVSQVERNVKANAAIQLRDTSSEPSSSSSEDESSEESDDETEEEPNNQWTRKTVLQNERKETIKEAIPIPLGEDDNETESYSASSDDESSEEGLDDEPEEPKKQSATKVEPQKTREEKAKEPIEITSDVSSSSSEDGSSGEDTDVEP
ncbi:unnamed protein product [Penicillium glandicola]